MTLTGKLNHKREDMVMSFLTELSCLVHGNRVKLQKNFTRIVVCGQDVNRVPPEHKTRYCLYCMLRQRCHTYFKSGKNKFGNEGMVNDGGTLTSFRFTILKTVRLKEKGQKSRHKMRFIFLYNIYICSSSYFVSCA